MTNTDLANLVNRRLGLTDAQAVTPNVIRQWVAWDVLPKAVAKGRSIGHPPNWSRPETALRRALRLAKLRQLGVNRQNAVIVQAFIEWGHGDLDRVRQALSAEMGKWRAQLIRYRTTRLGQTDYNELSAAQQRAIKTQLGKIDPRFVDAKIKQSDEFYAQLANLAEGGELQSERPSQLLELAISSIFPAFAAHGPDKFASPFISGIVGLFGSPDEIANSGQAQIESASDRELRIARIAMRRMFRMFGRMDAVLGASHLPASLSVPLSLLKSLSPQITVGPWAVMGLSQCLLSIQRNIKFPELGLIDV